MYRKIPHCNDFTEQYSGIFTNSWQFGTPCAQLSQTTIPTVVKKATGPWGL